MPDYLDIFWKLLFERMDCAIEFFRFLLKEKADLLELENLIFIQEIYYRKKNYCTTFFMKFHFGIQMRNYTFY